MRRRAFTLRGEMPGRRSASRGQLNVLKLALQPTFVELYPYERLILIYYTSWCFPLQRFTSKCLRKHANRQFFNTFVQEMSHGAVAIVVQLLAFLC